MMIILLLVLTRVIGSTTSTYNNAVGQYALSSVNTGGSNIGIGRNAGGNLTTANGNVYIGYGTDITIKLQH